MPTISRNVKFVSDEDGTTLLDLSKDEMIALNETGALIWRRLAAGGTLGDCATEFASAADIPLSVAAADVDEFVDDLKRRGLLVD